MHGFKHKLLAVMQHVVMVCQGEVLLLRYSGYQGNRVAGLWGLPGGHYIAGDPVDDLLREVSEETGLQLTGKPELLKTYVVKFPDGIERFGVFYLYQMGNGTKPVINLSYEHTEFRWTDLSGVKGAAFIGPYHKGIVEEVLS
ncbi:MAG: NUDIX hydrolase [Desulfotomaculaceae bacterium]|nr:NUDIX hydrolase [Desulfotomaculaceae bacterium]